MMMLMKDRRRGGSCVRSEKTPGVGSQLVDIIPHAGSVSRQEDRRRRADHGVGVSAASRGHDEAPNQGLSATCGTPASHETEMSAVTLTRCIGVAWTGIGKAAQRNGWIGEPAEGRTPVSGWSELAQEQRARVWQQPNTGTNKPSRNPRPVSRQFLLQRQEAT